MIEFLFLVNQMEVKMKLYNLENGIDVDVDIAKSLLELPEKQFYDYENFQRDFNLLTQNKKYNYLDFKNAYEIFSNKKKVGPKLYKNIYRDFVKKYNIFIKKIISSLDYCYADKIYKLLKTTYKNKDAILQRINKLSEIGIDHFMYVFETDLSDNLAKCNSINKIIDVATDGKITYERFNGPYCYINIKNAKYILEYSKEIKYDWAYNNYTMIVSNLMFDYSTLPTYEQLNNFNIKPYIDYENAKQNTTKQQKQELIDYILYTDDVLVKLNDLERRINNLINSSMNNQEGLSENELKKIQEIYTAILSHKNKIINNAIQNTSMSVDDITQAVNIKKNEIKTKILAKKSEKQNN